MDGPQLSGDSSSSNSNNRNSLGSTGSDGGGGRTGVVAHHRGGGGCESVSTEMSTVSQSFLYYQQHHRQQQQSTTDFQQQQPLATKATIQEHHPSTTYPRHQVQLPPATQQQEPEKKHIRYQPIQYQIEYEKQQFSQQQHSLSHRGNTKRAESNKHQQQKKRSSVNNDEVAVSLISSPSPPPTIVTIGHHHSQLVGEESAVASCASTSAAALPMSHPPIPTTMHAALTRTGTPTVIERSCAVAEQQQQQGDGGQEGENDGADSNNPGSEVANSPTGSTKRSRSKHRPLFRRLFHYVRNTLIGQRDKGDADECEVYELPPRYRPESVSSLCRITRFSEEEVKRLYRGFKAECPSGVVREDTFKIIYSQFFSARANTGNYAHFVFNTLDQDNSGIINFEDFLQTLSILSRGTVEEKLTWTFALYDINGDGCVTREEMTDIVTAIYDMVDRPPQPGDTDSDDGRQAAVVPLAMRMDGERIKQKVDQIFQKMDTNQDGVVTLDEFISCCRNDEVITNSMIVFDNIVL